MSQLSMSRSLGPQTRWTQFVNYMRKYWVFYLFILPAFLDVLIFRYGPMSGILIAFKDYKIRLGVFGSPWADQFGFEHFIKFVNSPNFLQILKNTLAISITDLIFGFPFPIFIALVINETRRTMLKKTTQMLTYMPHFISMVAVVGIINLVLDRESGLVNQLLVLLGQERVSFMTMGAAYVPIFVISSIWQESGYGSIIYLSALSAVDMECIEASRIDGATRLQKIWYIDIPTILPTIIIMLIMRSGSLLSVGFEKVFLLQNDMIRDVSEVISTYTYRLGVVGGQFSYTTAIGLFNNVLNALILIIVNKISDRVSGTSLL